MVFFHHDRPPIAGDAYRFGDGKAVGEAATEFSEAEKLNAARFIGQRIDRMESKVGLDKPEFGKRREKRKKKKAEEEGDRLVRETRRRDSNIYLSRCLSRIFITVSLDFRFKSNALDYFFLLHDIWN